MTMLLRSSCTDSPSQSPEEPKPSSWVPSYSIHSQGSTPLHAAQQTVDTDVVEIESLPAPAANVEVPREPSPVPVVEVAPEPEPMVAAAPILAATAPAEPAEEATTAEETAPVIVTETTVDEVVEVCLTSRTYETLC